MRPNYKQQELKNGKAFLAGKKMDYRIYHYSKLEWMIYGLEGVLLVLLLGYFFYRSWIWTFFLSPLIILFLKNKKRELSQKRRNTLSVQFKDALNVVNHSLQAGYSMENAFAEAYKDMVRYYSAESIIAKELFAIKKGIHNSQSIEELVQNLGERSGVEEISDFGNVLIIGKKSGGNLNEIIRSCISVIEEKIEIKQEIQMLISAKKLEAGIMAVIPFFIILYIEVTSKGYFDMLYNTVGGHILMSICLGIYIAAISISKKIIEIDV